jgi:mRNA-degrading endonuclease HigB of HigAB toxin-antitoxin module
MNTNKKEVKRKSELLNQIRIDLKTWEENQPDFDENYFDESDVISYYEFLINKYRDKWIIIDDTEGGDEK